MKRALWLAAGLAILGPPAAALGYISAYGVNAAHWDHLTIAELFDRYYRGDLTASFFLRPHLEHIKLFPRLAWLAMGLPSGFNNVVEMYANWAVLCAAATVLYFAVHRRMAMPHRSLIAHFILVVIVLFTLRQHEALLVGDGLIAYLCIAAGLISLAALDRGAILLACAAAFVASFSHLNGFVFWPLGVLLLASAPVPANRRGRLAAWLATAGAALTLYIWHWPETAGGSLSYALTHPALTLGYAIGAAGTPFGQAPWIQFAFGGAALTVEILVLIAALRGLRRGTAVPFGVWLILFALAVQVLIALGRTVGDAGVGIPGRYTVFIGLGIAGAYLAALELGRAARPLAIAAAAVILAGSIPGYAEGLYSGPAERDARLRAAHLLRTVPLQSDAAIERELYPFAGDARRYAAALERWRLNVFAQPLQFPEGLRRGAVPPGYAIDRTGFRPVAPGAPFEIAAGEDISLAGWAFDQHTWRPFASGFVRIEPGGMRIPIAYGLHRPDVVSVKQIRRPASPGFVVIFSSDVLARGENQLTLEFVAAGADRMVATPVIAVVVRR